MSEDSLRKVLPKLSEAIGISGYEAEAREVIRKEVEDLVDEVWVDALGNLLAVRKGKQEHPKILLDAHVDEIGFIVRYVHDNGFLRLTPIGGWDPRILPGHRVALRPAGTDPTNRVYGVIGATPPHLTTAAQREKVISIEDLYVDIGVFSKEAVEEMGIRIGTQMTVWQPYIEMPGDTVSGKAFDDRVGCLVIIEVLRRLAKAGDHKSTVAANFAVAEEVGGRGARTGAYTLEPDVAIALECTSAGDMPGIPKEKSPTQLGQGPALTVADRNLIVHPQVLATLEKVAKKENITYQIKQPLGGGTDGGPISQTRHGVPTGVVSVPCRYIHSAISLLQLRDIMATIDLVYGFTQTWKP
ncbi:MAG: M42 family metallopeptidase [Candidatus Odinarchaeota archaeon]